MEICREGEVKNHINLLVMYNKKLKILKMNCLVNGVYLKNHAYEFSPKYTAVSS